MSTEYLNVSIVICCYNSAPRLPETIRHLLAQEVPEGLLWEVIVVDNACTDNTTEVAQSLWPDNAPAPLRVVSEPEPGLSNARRKGFEQARYDLVSFVDDDNWVAANWVRLVSEIMMAHPEVGALGGRSEAVFETVPPEWFKRYQRAYAVGIQSPIQGDITWSGKWHEMQLWGAGLTVRKTAWQNLVAKCFVSIVSGRVGITLSSGEDYELCNALRLSGWKIWFEPKLYFRHYVPLRRLTWKYLKQLHRGFGASNTGIDPYLFLILNPINRPNTFLGKIWLWQILQSLYNLLIKNTIEFFFNGSIRLEGNPVVIANCFWLGKIEMLLKLRNNYDHNILAVRKAPWLKKRISNLKGEACIQSV